MNGFIIFAIIVVLILLYVWMTYNSLIRLRNQVKTNWAQIDVLLKRRADLIPNLVETVKGYAKHEDETLQKVIQARNTYVTATTPEEQMESTGELTQALNKLMMLQEAYPDLKADTQFTQLQTELSETENKISFSRQFYNDSVYSYHNKIEMFPSKIIASMFGFKPVKFFEVSQEDRVNPKVKF